MKLLRATLASFILLTVLTGIIYPLAITGIAKAVFPNQAEGSLIGKDGKPTNDESAAVGSALIGQTFDAPQYFWSRPSATSPQPYNAGASSGSNLGPTNSALTDAIKGRIDTLHQADPSNRKPIPVDLVTASASGLDPQESIAAAEYQVSRVAAARQIDPAKLEPLISANTVTSVMAESAVNVVRLNLALDAAFPFHAATTAAPITAAPLPATK
jgi:K+-transporting ATPase ATPase C chain